MAVLAIVALFATACGSRLSEEDIAVYAGGTGGGAGGRPGPVAAGGTGGGQATGSTGGVAPGAAGGGTDGGSGGGGANASGTGGGGGGAGGGGAATGGAGGGGTSGGGGGAGGGGGGGEAGGGGGQDGGGGAAADTRAAPPGGNGGKTDTGVSADTITVYNVVDRTGPVPGLFQDAQEAAAAYFLKFASEEGTVYGRQIKLVQRDSKMSAQENRSAYLDACNNAFAAVASMSAFEQGAGEALQCGIPDLRTAAVAENIQTIPNVVSTDAMKPGLIPLSEWAYYKQFAPGAEKRAGYLWVDNSTTTYQTRQNRSATRKNLGYEWIEEIPIALSEVNYASIVQQLKSSDVRLVAFQGAPQQAARLAKTMEQQNYRPDVFALQSNTYGPILPAECGSSCENIPVLIQQGGALVEEIESNPELQEYAEWLQRVNPRARPTGLGIYAWSAARLFVDKLKEIGPDLTRPKLLDALRQETAYEGNGLLPPQNLKTQVPTDCNIVLRLEGGQFVREAPAQGYLCRDQPGAV